MLFGKLKKALAWMTSRKKTGSPAVKSMKRYGTRKVPPPCLKHRNGNLQTFPEHNLKSKEET